MMTLARWCAPLALVGALGGVSGDLVYAQPEPGFSRPPLSQQIADGYDGAREAPDGAIADEGPPDLPAPAPAPAPAVVNANSRVAIARRIVDAAGAFDGYMRRAAAIKADFASGASVARAVRLGSTFQAGQLSEGAVAYAALVALQDPEFVEIVSEVAQDPGARDEFAERILKNPEAVLDAPAARRTGARVAGVLGRMGVQLVTAGAAVKQSAYDIQHQHWSLGPISAPEQRLARIKADSAGPISLVPADTAHLFTGLMALRDEGAEGPELQEGQATAPVATRGLAVAALAILGRAGDDQAETISPLLKDAKDSQCIEMARLNLHQCLAVAGPHYEDVFCLGRHAMIDTGRCIASAAGVSDDTLRPAMDTTSVLVPVALEASVPSGPERESAFGRAPSASQDDVSVPTAASAPPPANYSPYSGPTDR